MDNMRTNTPRLETERLILRRFEPGDVDAILEIYGDPVVMKFVPVIPLKSKEEAEQLLWERYLSKYEAEYGCDYAICLKEDKPITLKDYALSKRMNFTRWSLIFPMMLSALYTPLPEVLYALTH